MALAHDTLTRLDQLIHESTLLAHPFYQAWNAGTLTPAQLAGYARLYYGHIAAFPEYLGLAADASHDPAVTALLEANQAEEVDGPISHPELWLRFSDSLGNSRVAVASEAPAAETLEADATYRALMGDGDLTALAALYAYESQIPAVADTKIAGLAAHYGDLRADAGYFWVHRNIDAEHAADARTALLERIHTDADADAVLEAGQRAASAALRLLDGVCARYAVACPSMN